MKILFSYDGSNCAKDALRELKRAGLPERGEALILTVAEPWHAPVGPGGHKLDMSPLGDETTALKQADEARSLFTELFPGWQVEAEGRQGSPSHQIVDRADQWGADLIVIGSHGLNAVERFVFGSISQQVVTSAHCSVRVARGNPHREDEPIRLLLGVDGSQDSNETVETVLARDWPPHTKVWLVTAIGSYFEDEANERERNQFEELHASIEARFKEKGVTAVSVIDFTDPKHLILATAKEFEIDCIFLGSRGLTRFERTLIGSVSASITARSQCSVEIVRKREN